MGGGKGKRDIRLIAARAILFIAAAAVLGSGYLAASGFFEQDLPERYLERESGRTEPGSVREESGGSGSAASVPAQTPEDGPQTSAQTESGSSEEATEDAEAARRAELTARAVRLAAGYDYPAAKALITGYAGYENDPEMARALAGIEEAERAAVKYPNMTEVTHLFFHSLIIDPSLAFDGDRDAVRYNEVMTTAEEFRRIIREMYDRGYVLVSIRDVGSLRTQPDGSTRMTPGEIYLPEGRIPYVLSLDDMSYYHYMEGDGFASRVLPDSEGNPVCEYIRPDGTAEIGAFDAVPILEDFIREHPDAAYRGARGIIALTGYNGVLGYRTDPVYASGAGADAEQRAWLDAHPEFDYERECADARAAAEALKAAGWEFASHSYGHINCGSVSYEQLVRDTEAWDASVRPIVGDTDILIYPFGADIGDWHPYTEENSRYVYLRSRGFTYFCNVDSNRYWVQFGGDYLRQGRRNLDGIRMWQALSGEADRVSDLFDVSEVFDPARPTPVR